MITKILAFSFSVITLNMLSEIYIYTIPIKVRGVRSPFKKLGRIREFVPT